MQTPNVISLCTTRDLQTPFDVYIAHLITELKGNPALSTLYIMPPMMRHSHRLLMMPQEEIIDMIGRIREDIELDTLDICIRNMHVDILKALKRHFTYPMQNPLKHLTFRGINNDGVQVIASIVRHPSLKTLKLVGELTLPSLIMLNRALMERVGPPLEALDVTLGCPPDFLCLQEGIPVEKQRIPPDWRGVEHLLMVGKDIHNKMLVEDLITQLKTEPTTIKKLQLLNTIPLSFETRCTLPPPSELEKWQEALCYNRSIQYIDLGQQSGSYSVDLSGYNPATHQDISVKIHTILKYIHNETAHINGQYRARADKRLKLLVDNLTLSGKSLANECLEAIYRYVMRAWDNNEELKPKLMICMGKMECCIFNQWQDEDPNSEVRRKTEELKISQFKRHCTFRSEL